jgi:hypothetical protein
MAYIMPKRRMRLNNKKMRYFRKQQFYDAVFADLVLMGALSKNVVETYFNAEVPNSLAPPWDGPPPYPSISDLDLTQKLTSGGSTVPVTGANIVRDFPDVQYKGAIRWYRLVDASSDPNTPDPQWSLEAGNTFQANAVYCAFVHITPETGYSTTGITWTDWTHNSTASPWKTVKANPALPITVRVDSTDVTVPPPPNDVSADVAFAFAKTGAA